jgi:hypothetical protein
MLTTAGLLKTKLPFKKDIMVANISELVEVLYLMADVP